MPRSAKRRALAPTTLEKAPTGIGGLDDITGGGLPRGRPTLVCGGPGCGKTVLALEFLVHGAVRYGEPGVMIAFEETAEDLAKNVASLGVDLAGLVRQRKIAVDYMHVDRSEMVESGAYDLSGLFLRVDQAIASIGAKRIVIDSIEVLLSGFSDAGLMRAELERLFRGLKERGITAIITGERGDGVLTRHGLEEYVSDCVLLLDQRVVDQVTTRRLRVVKYRGSSHGADEFPFLITSKGLSVLPITGLGLDYAVDKKRVSTGVPALDEMLDGQGYFRTSSVLVSGTAGTGKSSFAASFVDAACARGEKVLYFALEEPAGQVARNMASIGIHLERWRKAELLEVVSARPTISGLEQHLVTMHNAIRRFRPRAVIVDPMSSLLGSNRASEVRAMLVRLFDFLKQDGITGLFTYLGTPSGLGETDVGVSSLIDTWIELRDLEHRGERNKVLYILKSRGMPHSNQVRELLITNRGLDLVDAFIGPNGPLVGSARAQEERGASVRDAGKRAELEHRQRAAEQRRAAVEAQVAALQAELAIQEEEVARAAAELASAEARERSEQDAMRQSKRGYASSTARSPRRNAS